MLQTAGRQTGMPMQIMVTAISAPCQRYKMAAMSFFVSKCIVTQGTKVSLGGGSKMDLPDCALAFVMAG